MNDYEFGHEGNEFLGGKEIHPKLPTEVHFIGWVNITIVGHQSKSRIKK